jgi:carboxymethylenebutenolidase
MTQISAADGHSLSCYRADPEGAPLGAVVVVQEMFGINPHIRKIADGFAAKGFVAIAPALFDRVKPGVELGYDAQGAAEGAELVRQLDLEGCLADLQAAAQAVKDAGKVAIVGYSWGGYLAFLSANEIPGLACAVSYYGDGVADPPVAKRRIPTLIHFAENDPNLPFEEVQQFRASRPEVSAFTYAAGPGFNCDERPSFDEAAACAAGERTLFWISQFVVGQAPIQLKNSGAYAAAKVEKKKKAPAGGDDMGPPLD